MRAILRVAILCLVALSPSFCLADKFNHYQLDKLKGFRLEAFGAIGLKKSKNPQNVVRDFQANFINYSKEEIAEIDLHLVVKLRSTGKTVFEGKIYTMKDFGNELFPHRGSLLPYNKGRIAKPFTYDYPGKFWTTDTIDYLDISDIRTFKGPQNLHDIGHLFSKFNFIKPSEALEIVKKDPSICKGINSFGVTAGHVAIMTQNPEVIESFLAHGAVIAKPSQSGMNTLEFAALSDLPETIEYVVNKHGGKLNEIGASTPLYRATVIGNLTGVKWMLAHGASPTLEPSSGNSPSFGAIHGGYPEILKELVKAGVDPKALNKDGFSWMHAATSQPSMLGAVAKYGIPVDVVNPKSGMTPLIYSVILRRSTATTWLLKHGANPDAKDNKGQTIFDYVKKNNTLHTDMWLREEVKKISTYGKKG